MISRFQDTFVLLFNGKNSRFTLEMKNMISRFQDIFGDHFWPNVVFAVSYWGFGEHDIEDRTQTEKEWTDAWNRKFSDLSTEKRVDIPAVFIDSHYKKSRPVEYGNFSKEMDKLWKFANKAKRFELKDIKIALSEIEKLESELKNEKRKAQDLRLDEEKKKENKICLLGDNLGCIQLPGLGGISTGIFILGVVLGSICGCQGSAESAPGSSSSVWSWAPSAAARARSSATCSCAAAPRAAGSAARNDPNPPPCALLLLKTKTSRSTSPWATTTILRRKSKT